VNVVNIRKIRTKGGIEMRGNIKHLVFCVCVAFVLLSAFGGVASARTIYVPDDYAKIQEGVEAASSVKLNVPYFNQCDDRWGNDTMGTPYCTLCSCGCAVTSVVMVLNYYGVHASDISFNDYYVNDTNPKDLNKWLKENKGYLDDFIIWSSVEKYSDAEEMGIDFVEDELYNWPGGINVIDVDVVREEIESGHPVIVNVGGHWVVITGIEGDTYYINDPFWSDRKTLASYNNTIYGIRVYHGEIPYDLIWESKASMPTARSWTDAVVYNGKIYVVGGCSCLSDCQQFYNAVGTLEVYDPLNDSWAVLTPMSIPRVGPAVAVVDGKIYVMGGFNRDTWSANPTVEVYDIATDTWSTGTPMPTPRSWARAVVLNKKIYVLGGVGYHYYNVCEVYDPATDTWTSCAPFKTGRYLHAATAANGKIYIIGGDSWEYGHEVYSDIQEYDPLTDSWTTKTPMPTAATGLDAITADNKIWVFGGGGLCLVYNIANDQWEEKTSNQNTSGSFSVAYLDGVIYRFGGGGWGPTLDIVEAVEISPTPTPTPTPSVSISTDKYEYTAGDVMLINITITNPTSEWKGVKFLWILDILDYDMHFIIKNRSLMLPPHYDKTFMLRWKLPELKSSFNASWHVAIFNATTSELISEDHADWKYVVAKAKKMTLKDVKELEKSVREMEIS